MIQYRLKENGFPILCQKFFLNFLKNFLTTIRGLDKNVCTVTLKQDSLQINVKRHQHFPSINCPVPQFLRLLLYLTKTHLIPAHLAPWLKSLRSDYLFMLMFGVNMTWRSRTESLRFSPLRCSRWLDTWGNEQVYSASIQVTLEYTFP